MNPSQQKNLMKSNPGAADRIQSTISQTGNQNSEISDIMKQNTIKGATSPKSARDVKLPDFNY